MSDLVSRLKEGVPYAPKRWSGDCGEMSRVDEAATDQLLLEAAQELIRLRAALQRIADCDWPGPRNVLSRADFMQEIAKEALQ